MTTTLTTPPPVDAAPEVVDAYLDGLTPEQREVYDAACAHLLGRDKVQRLDDEAYLCPHFGGRLLLRAERWAQR